MGAIINNGRQDDDDDDDTKKQYCRVCRCSLCYSHTVRFAAVVLPCMNYVINSAVPSCKKAQCLLLNWNTWKFEKLRMLISVTILPLCVIPGVKNLPVTTVLVKDFWKNQISEYLALSWIIWNRYCAILTWTKSRASACFEAPCS